MRINRIDDAFTNLTVSKNPSFSWSSLHWFEHIYRFTVNPAVTKHWSLSEFWGQRRTPEFSLTRPSSHRYYVKRNMVVHQLRRGPLCLSMVCPHLQRTKASWIDTANKLFHDFLTLSEEVFSEVPATDYLQGHNFKVCQPRFHLAKWKRTFALHSALYFQLHFFYQIYGYANSYQSSSTESMPMAFQRLFS